jgi:hypothetical protein
MKRVRYFLFRYKLIWIVLLCAIALLVFSASTTHAYQQPPACPNQHYVQFGQNLFRIGLSYGYTTINVPCGPGSPGTGGPGPVPPPYYCRSYHLVAQGQTLRQIEAIYGVNQYLIAQANLITNLDLIYAGETLCIP